MKEQRLGEIEKTRMETYEKAERRFVENLKLKEANF